MTPGQGCSGPGEYPINNELKVRDVALHELLCTHIQMPIYTWVILVQPICLSACFWMQTVHHCATTECKHLNTQYVSD